MFSYKSLFHYGILIVLLISLLFLNNNSPSLAPSCSSVPICDSRNSLSDYNCDSVPDNSQNCQYIPQLQVLAKYVIPSDDLFKSFCYLLDSYDDFKPRDVFCIREQKALVLRAPSVSYPDGTEYSSIMWRSSADSTHWPGSAPYSDFSNVPFHTPIIRVIDSNGLIVLNIVPIVGGEFHNQIHFVVVMSRIPQYSIGQVIASFTPISPSPPTGSLANPFDGHGPILSADPTINYGEATAVSVSSSNNNPQWFYKIYATSSGSIGVVPLGIYAEWVPPKSNPSGTLIEAHNGNYAIGVNNPWGDKSQLFISNVVIEVDQLSASPIVTQSEMPQVRYTFGDFIDYFLDDGSGPPTAELYQDILGHFDGLNSRIIPSSSSAYPTDLEILYDHEINSGDSDVKVILSKQIDGSVIAQNPSHTSFTVDAANNKPLVYSRFANCNSGIRNVFRWPYIYEFSFDSSTPLEDYYFETNGNSGPSSNIEFFASQCNDMGTTEVSDDIEIGYLFNLQKLDYCSQVSSTPPFYLFNYLPGNGLKLWDIVATSLSSTPNEANGAEGTTGQYSYVSRSLWTNSAGFSEEIMVVTTHRNQVSLIGDLTGVSVDDGLISPEIREEIFAVQTHAREGNSRGNEAPLDSLTLCRVPRLGGPSQQSPIAPSNILVS